MIQKVKIRDIATFVRGVSYKKEQAQKENSEGYTAILRANNISAGSILLDDLVYVPNTLISDDQIVNKGDIVITMSSGSKAHVGKVALAKESMNCAFGAFCGKLLCTGILPPYLFYLLMSKRFRSHIESQCKGTNINNIKQGYILDYEIVLPPKTEQERIVAWIEELFSELDNGVETLRKTKQQLAVYRQVVLRDAFSELDTFVSLQSISDKIFDGPFGSNLKTSDYTTSGIRVVRLENLKDGWFDDSKQSFVTQEKYDTISRHTVYPTDLIVSTFIADSIKVCQLPEYVGFAVNKADCIGIRVKASNMPRYVMYYLMTKTAYNSLVHEVHGATRPRVNTKQIKGIQIPVCDLSVQHQIVADIESRLSVCDIIEKNIDTALQQAEAMRQSILKQAFEGRL